MIGDIQGIREGNDKGSLFNQKLHSLPYLQFYGKLEYKLKLEGINLKRALTNRKFFAVTAHLQKNIMRSKTK